MHYLQLKKEECLYSLISGRLARVFFLETKEQMNIAECILLMELSFRCPLKSLCLLPKIKYVLQILPPLLLSLS